MIMDYDKFIESKIAFINEFFNSTRPAYELAAFMEAFDTCKCSGDDVMPITLIESNKPDDKPVGMSKLVVNPSSQIFKFSSSNETLYCVGITAAANALGVKGSGISKAVNKGYKIHGYTIEIINASDLRIALKKE